jgi:acyl-CoA thioester hydrolase
MSNADAPSIGRIADGVHLVAARVYYEDTDFTGVVYHANYLRYFERGRSEFLRAMRTGTDDPEIGIFAVIRMEVDFQAPARIHDELVIETRFMGLKGPRMIFNQRVRRHGQILCEALVTAVALTPDGRARKPTPEERRHWQRFAPPASPTEG